MIESGRGAMAERGLAENLSIAIIGLTTAVTKASEQIQRDTDEHEKSARKRHREWIEEVRMLTDAMKRRV